MKFSVLISVYYKEQPQYLVLALNSIFNQSVLPDEVILVKDGPLTEELNNIILEFCKNYAQITVVPLDTNVGLGKALNEGLKHCSNNLIARMDTDDIAKYNRFEKQLAVFEKYPNIDICSAWIEEFEGNTDNILSVRKLPEMHDDIIRFAKHRCPINHPVVMYKKDCVTKVGGYEGFPEDYRLWIKMIMNGAIFYNLQECLLSFRFSRDMIKRRGGWKYAYEDVKSQINFHKMGFISFAEMMYNISIRTTVRLTPTVIRDFIYKKILRKK